MKRCMKFTNVLNFILILFGYKLNLLSNENSSSFWKNGKEIDIVHKEIPIEIKYQEAISSEDFKPLREFMKKFNKKESLIITKNEEKEIKFKEGAIKLIPAWKWFIM